MRKESLERFVVKAAIEKALNKDTIERLTQKLLAYQSRENTRLPVLPAALKDVNNQSKISYLQSNRESLYQLPNSGWTI